MFDTNIGMGTVWEALVRCERRWLWAFVVVCLLPTVTGCPDNYSYLAHTYRCYRAYGSHNTYDEAVATCLANGGSLAMPRDNTTNSFLVALKNNVSTSSTFRFGLHRRNETWKYVDGGELGNFTDWAENEPNNLGGIEQCAEYFPGAAWWYLEHNRDKWNDGICSIQRGFICEAEPDYCKEESVDTEAGQVTFPRTDGGSFSYSAEHCNSSAENEKPLASRFCRITTDGHAVWDQPVLLTCGTDFKNLSQIVVNNETALSVATELQLITTQAEILSSSEVNSIIATLQKIVNASATEQQNPSWVGSEARFRFQMRSEAPGLTKIE
ncbi:hypothetical protein Bbelb_283810 [Branchiostoma belcheri]|nr:hypothetical protein Bbelb_283810 [Branchiostoma belcheri]